MEVIIPADQRWEPAEEVLQQLARTMFRDEVEYRRVDAENPLDFGQHAGVALLEEAYTEAWAAALSTTRCPPGPMPPTLPEQAPPA
ncbi:hypothetical protein [Rhodothermus marinus]|uniref:hypothetical protein n=1 Tax=Rhodothermus marinus TaxID=29549 RepID=UPI001FB32F9A|nr:hypothetical protein [Rhodothermus marinus]